jgi:protoporphyrinogen oxidase
LGLTLALRAAERGCRVTVLEAADRLGGLADAWQLGNVTWDRHYHVTLLSDTSLRRLLADIGLDDDLVWRQTRTGFYIDGHLHSLSSTAEFLRFPALRLDERLRLAWTIVYASRIRDWQALEQIPVGDWLRRHSGERTFARIWLPLLQAKLGSAWERTSAAFIWATIQRMYAARRTGLKQEMFGYVRGGYARVLGRLRERLTALGVEIRTGARVSRIEPAAPHGLAVATAAGEQLAFERVAVTAPPSAAARLCTALSESERQRLEQIEYLGIICASLLLQRPLAGYYVTNVADAAPFTGVIEMTALVQPEELAGQHLVYLPKYVTRYDATFEQSDDTLRASFLSALARIYPQFRETDVAAFRVSRVRHVFALPTLGYSRQVPPVATSVPGLFLVNSAQIVNSTLNVNQTVRLAEEAVDTLLAPLPPVRSSKHHHDPAPRELVARLG